MIRDQNAEKLVRSDCNACIFVWIRQTLNYYCLVAKYLQVKWLEAEFLIFFFLSAAFRLSMHVAYVASWLFKCHRTQAWFVIGACVASTMSRARCWIQTISYLGYLFLIRSWLINNFIFRLFLVHVCHYRGASHVYWTCRMFSELED